MAKLNYYIDWWLRDTHTRRGKYVIAEAPNPPLIAFMVSLVIGVLIYPGFLQTLLFIIAYGSLTVWSWLELKSGRSRFRKLLGSVGLLAVAIALIIHLGI